MKKIKTKKVSKIPEFKSYEEEAKWFETHSISDYLSEFESVDARFAKNLSEGITIRFDDRTLRELRSVAHEKGIGPTTLARMWIIERLKRTVAD